MFHRYVSSQSKSRGRIIHKWIVVTHLHPFTIKVEIPLEGNWVTTSKKNTFSHLVGGFNPSEKNSQLG